MAVSFALLSDHLNRDDQYNVFELRRTILVDCQDESKVSQLFEKVYKYNYFRSNTIHYYEHNNK